MLFVIKRMNGAYYHNKNKIILFESEQDAENFINLFARYSTERLISENNPIEAMKAPMIIMSESKIIPIDFDIKKHETIYAKELMEKINK